MAEIKLTPLNHSGNWLAQKLMAIGFWYLQRSEKKMFPIAVHKF
jgi:hypothetical protein